MKGERAEWGMQGGQAGRTRVKGLGGLVTGFNDYLSMFSSMGACHLNLDFCFSNFSIVMQCSSVCCFILKIKHIMHF